MTRARWRTLRADGVERLQPIGRQVEFVDPPDPARLVSRSVATGPYPARATVRLPLPMDEALRLIPSSVGSHSPEGPDVTIVDVGGPDAPGTRPVPPRPGDAAAGPVAGRGAGALLRRTGELLRENADARPGQ